MAFPPPTRSLLNPKFNGYKLEALEQSEVVRSYHIPVAATQATVSGRALLSFQEVASRIKHNHLAIAHNGRALYIDAQFCVNLVAFDESSEPSFYRIFEIPVIRQSTDEDIRGGEYPEAVSLDHEHWIISDGWGRLYLIRVPTDVVSVAAHVIATVEIGLRSCRLHHAVLRLGGIVIVVLSTKVVPDRPLADSPRTKSSSLAQFDILAGQFVIDDTNNESLPLNILWRRRGADVPRTLFYDAEHDVIIVTSGSEYLIPDNEVAHPEEPAADEYAPIPRADHPLAPDVQTPPRPPPYSWTQTDDSVTVAIALPSSASKAQIKVHISPRTLDLSIHDPNNTLAGLSLLPLPRYSLEQFWDGVSPSSSFWTWDALGDKNVGLLTLHLDKQHEGTRWPHVFNRAAAGDGGDDVPETLDPSQLWHIREALEKYTSDLGTDSIGLGGLKGSSLVDGELDADEDANVGMPAFITRVSLLSGDASAETLHGTLLSLPLPGFIAYTHSLVLKNDIDGVLYDHSASAWEHAATYPALAFVLASKRELRFVYHLGARLLLAFESGGADGGGNVYLYRAPERSQDSWAGQAVLKIGGGTAGSLLGVGAVQTPGGNWVVVCLCERELTVVQLGDLHVTNGISDRFVGCTRAGSADIEFVLMMVLVDLPIDVLALILDALDQTSLYTSLSALVRVSHAVYDVAISRLYRQVIVYSVPRFIRFARTLDTRPSLGSFVRIFSEKSVFLVLLKGQAPLSFLSHTLELHTLELASPIDLVWAEALYSLKIRSLIQVNAIDSTLPALLRLDTSRLNNLELHGTDEFPASFYVSLASAAPYLRVLALCAPDGEIKRTFAYTFLCDVHVVSAAPRRNSDPLQILSLLRRMPPLLEHN